MGRMVELVEAHEIEDPVERATAIASLYQAAYTREVASRRIEAAQTPREMLHILQSRLLTNSVWYRYIRDAGGPDKGRLDGYISGVLAGYAMRVDYRLKPILLALESGAERGVYLGPFPRGLAVYHPGKRPEHRKRRIALKRAAEEARRNAGRAAADTAGNPARGH